MSRITVDVNDCDISIVSALTTDRVRFMSQITCYQNVWCYYVDTVNLEKYKFITSRCLSLYYSLNRKLLSKT